MSTMLFPTAPAPQYLRNLKERHHEIKRRLVAGDQQVDIARALGMTQSRLSIIVNSPAFQTELLALRMIADREAADVAGRIKNLCPDAMTVLEDAIRKTPEGVSPLAKVGIAKDVLVFGGYGPSRGPQASEGLYLTPADIDMIKARRAKPVSAEVVLENA